MNQPLLTVENLKVAYPSHNTSEIQNWAVNDVSFTLDYGEILALVGESGCGKSTIGRTIMRLVPSKTTIEGKVSLQGQSIFSYNELDLRRFRGEAVGLVFQDPMTRLDPLMTIGEHCLETLKAHQPELSRQSAKDKSLNTLNAVKIPQERWNQYPHEFSGGMRQRVAIALALLLEPKLIIADEPTTSLDVTVASEILDELTRLCQERNMGLLLISHDLAMVAKYCQRVAVMYQGKIVEIGTVDRIFRSPNHEYTKSLLDAALHLHHNSPSTDDLLQSEDQHGNLALPDNNKSNTEPSDENLLLLNGNTLNTEPSGKYGDLPLLALENLQKHYTIEVNLIQQFLKNEAQVIKAVDNINLEIHPGETLGLVGESGCGKSTLSRTILRLIPPTAGKIKFLGQDLTTLPPTEIRSLRREMQMIFQDPNACLNPLMTIGEAIAEPLFIHQLGNKQEIRNQVERMLKRVGLTPISEYFYRYPKQLSGGQQQRVAIARALITRPKLVICDEPVSMLDASIQAQVLELMLELKTEFNLTYLFITHDLSVARFFCDRIAVMNKGQIVELDRTEQVFTNPQHPYTKQLLNAAPVFLVNQS
jgi:peptide/nickel transport system ATP-binding protein